MRRATCFFLQNEVNKLDYMIRRGAEKGMFIALNPSPYDEQVETCGLQQVDLFFVNEIEAATDDRRGLGKPCWQR